jgi:hypothetical protein
MTRPILLTLCCTQLIACAPTFDVQLRNDTGSALTVATPLGKPPDVGITRNVAAPVDILVAPDGIMERFSVIAPYDSWTYFDYLGAFANVPASLREQRNLGATRIHARIDRAGRIYLLSPSDQPVPQTRGFPISPQVHDRHAKIII